VLRTFLRLLVLALVLAACSPPARRAGVLPPPRDSWTLGPGDKFDVHVVGEEKFPREYTVAADGTVNFPWIHKQMVSGVDPLALGEQVRQKLIDGGYLADPTVIVTVKEYNSKRIVLGGAVTKPGDYQYVPGLTLVRLITGAGGFTATANRQNVLVTRKLQDGTRRTVSFATDDIVEGRAPDVPMQAGDAVYVYERPF
jgi:polysaccharide biosynthesis/export protein